MHHPINDLNLLTNPSLKSLIGYANSHSMHLQAVDSTAVFREKEKTAVCSFA
jgi:hypothetical protein